MGDQIENKKNAFNILSGYKEKSRKKHKKLSQKEHKTETSSVQKL